MTQKIKILSIDDDQLVRRSFRFFLEDLGYKVVEAESGREGLELATSEHPDLILLDLRMPDIDGLKTLSILQARNINIPVIVISGTGDIQDVLEALRRGAWDYLTKPITNMSVLEHAINKSLERDRLVKENQAYQEALETKVKKRTSELEEVCRQLDSSKQTLEALFQAAPLAIVLLNNNQHITLWNRGAELLFGWNATEVEGHPCPLLDTLEEEEYARLIQPGLDSHEQELKTKSGATLTLRISTAGIEDNRTNPGGIVMLLEDISEQKRLQTEADRANRLASLGELAAGVAHEINNPNGLILLNMPTMKAVVTDALELLQDERPEVKVGGLSLKRAMEVIPPLTEETEDAARRIRQIVEDLKDFTSRDSRTSAVHFKLNHSVEKALRLTANAIKKSTDSFSYALLESLPNIYGNPQRIEQVIVNLLLNACEALTVREASLKLETKYDPVKNLILLQVTDQGRGIEPLNMKYITDPFFTTRRESGGTGLGLSVSARIAREHGGQLSFESQPGKGTTATLSLPAHPEAT